MNSVASLLHSLAPRSGALLLLATLACPTLAATTPGTPPPASAGEKMAGTVQPSRNDQLARQLAGMDPALATRLPEYKAYSARVDAAWTRYDARIAQPMTTWAAAEVPQKPGETVFYPFSGPDLPTVLQLHPNAQRYVLVAIQTAGKPVDMEKLSAKDQAKVFATLSESWSKFGILGFFRTEDLDEAATAKTARIGPTTVLMAFAARMGFKVESVQPIQLDAQSGQVQAAPPDTAEWRSVRLVLNRDGRKVVVDYLKQDLSDSGLSKFHAGELFVRSAARNPVVLKAASHLPQDAKFHIIRDAILETAPNVVQDETGMDYALLTQAFEVKLYGHYVKAHRLFKQLKHASLAQAYRERTDVRPLAFRIGYDKSSGFAVQVAARKPPAKDKS